MTHKQVRPFSKVLLGIVAEVLCIVSNVSIRKIIMWSCSLTLVFFMSHSLLCKFRVSSSTDHAPEIFILQLIIFENDLALFKFQACLFFTIGFLVTLPFVQFDDMVQ
jgi:hypothetical protein